LFLGLTVQRDLQKRQGTIDLTMRHPQSDMSKMKIRPHFYLRYALDGLPNKILATEYRTVLPDEQLIAAEIEKTRRQLEALRK
jgi:hypothetical protein